MTSVSSRLIADDDKWIEIDVLNVDPDYLATYHPAPLSTKVWVYLKGTQRLFEAITPNSSPDHKSFKAFEHYKAETNWAHGIRMPILLTTDVGAGNGLLSRYYTRDDRFFNQYTGFGSSGKYNTGLNSWYVPREDGGFIPVPDNLEQLKRSGLQAMMPKIKGELQSLVSLYEIKDLLSIRGTIKNLTNVAKSLALKWGSTRAIGKVLAHGAGDSYLQWMFNIRPLISDIGGIYRAVATYERRVNDLVSRSATTQTAHFMCNLKESLLTTDEVGATNQPVTGHPLGICFQGSTSRAIRSRLTVRRRYVTDSAVFRSTMQYNYSYSAYQREHAKMLGLLDALGVNFNPSYIWNVIPWSFVIDWVVDVGQWLNQFEVKNMEPKVNILQYCWSIKKVRRQLMYGECYTNLNYDPPMMNAPQYFELPEVRETSYRRGTDLPSTSSFTTSGLSPTELSLGAALLVTRRRSKRRKP